MPGIVGSGSRAGTGATRVVGVFGLVAGTADVVDAVRRGVVIGNGNADTGATWVAGMLGLVARAADVLDAFDAFDGGDRGGIVDPARYGVLLVAVTGVAAVTVTCVGTMCSGVSPWAANAGTANPTVAIPAVIQMSDFFMMLSP